MAGRSNSDLHGGSLESRDNAPVEVDPEMDRRHAESRSKQFGVPAEWIPSISEGGKAPSARFTGMYLGATGNKSLVRATRGGGPDGTEIDWKTDPTGVNSLDIGSTFDFEGKWNPEKSSAPDPETGLSRFVGGMDWRAVRKSEKQMPVPDHVKQHRTAMRARAGIPPRIMGDPQ